MTENDPITLAEACEIVFRNTITPATLKAEHGRGRLVISKIGRAYFTTLRDARELLEKCRVERVGRDFTLTRTGAYGSSATDTVLSARAAAEQTAEKLKGCLRNTSARNIARSLRPTR